MVTQPTDFRCDDCGAAPGAPCIYIWPTNAPPWTITVYRAKESHRWENITVPWNGYQPYVEQIKQAERWIKIGGGEVQWLVSDGIGKLYAKVGLATDRPHNARHQALYAWEQDAERRVHQDYLREWLDEHGNIFSNAN